MGAWLLTFSNGAALLNSKKKTFTHIIINSTNLMSSLLYLARPKSCSHPQEPYLVGLQSRSRRVGHQRSVLASQDSAVVARTRCQRHGGQRSHERHSSSSRFFFKLTIMIFFKPMKTRNSKPV